MVVDGFGLVFGDGEVEADFAGEVEAVDDDIGVVDFDCGVGVFFYGVDAESFEGDWAVD